MKWSYDPLHRTYDAGRWINSTNTKSSQLLNVLTFFVEEGLPEEHLDEFLDGIVPSSGWHKDDYSFAYSVRKTHEYTTIVSNLILATAARRNKRGI